MADEHGLLLKKPVSVLNRELGLNLREFLKSVIGLVISGATLSAPDAFASIIDGAAAFKLKDDPGLMAYQLIYRSVLNAILRIAGESRHHLIGFDKIDQENIVKHIDLSLENEEVYIDHNFFDNPRELHLLNDIEKMLSKVLVDLSMDKSRAKTTTKRLKSYFVMALHYEWIRHHYEYDIIAKAVKSPFTQAQDMERAWLWYADYFEEMIAEPVFGFESFCLDDIYVPLRAYYQVDDASKVIGVGEAQSRQQRNIPVYLQETLCSWAENFKDKGKSLMVVSGGPGSGKSTSAKIFARDMAISGQKVIFIPLFELDLSGDLEDRVGRYAQRIRGFPQNPIKDATPENTLLLIFDGLDELHEHGSAAVSNARNFISDLKAFLRGINRDQVRCLALVTGRTVAMQAAGLEGINREQCLNLIEYFIDNNTRNDFLDPNNILEEDQRDVWWRKYGDVTGENYEGIPIHFKKGNRLTELTSQPLLNYLVALLAGDPVSGIDFAKGEINMGKVYNQLINHIHRRTWAKVEYEEGHPVIKGVKKEDFLEVMQSIAVKAWHGKGRIITISEAEQCCAGLKSKEVQEIAKQAESGVLNLLTAFYFRQRMQGEKERTFEFTHKSFQEYLTAGQIINEIKSIYQALTHSASRFTEENALIAWTELCGPTAIDENLLEFLRDLIALEHYSGQPTIEWQKMFGSLIGYMLVHGMPMRKLGYTLEYKEMLRQSQNSEVSLLSCMNACALVTKLLSDIESPNLNRNSISIWLHNLTCPYKHTTVHKCLNYINLSGLNLEFMNLGEADLSYSNLSKCNLAKSNLCRANLQGAILTLANLYGADLDYAFLAKADLSKANINGALLCGANLYNSNLYGTNLSYSDLFLCNFSEAFIDTETNFNFANLQLVSNLDPKWIESSIQTWEEPVHMPETAMSYTRGYHWLGKTLSTS